MPASVFTEQSQPNNRKRAIAKVNLQDPELSPDRRHCVRQRVHAPAFASFDGVTGGMILDLSEEGMAMQAAAPVEARGRVQVQMQLAEPAAYLETTGYIAWADALGRAGVRFSELPEEARRRLDDWLAQHAGAPSRTAPKLTVGRTTFPSSRRDGSRAWPTEHVAISLEPEPDTAEHGEERATAHSVSGTVQYEFSPLSTDLNAALKLIGERARSLTRGASAAIALAHKGSVLCRASVGASAPALGTRLEANSGICGECFRTGKSLRCDDTEIDPRVDAETCQRLGIRSVLAAPIRYERETVGLLAVFGAQTFAFDEGDVAVAESLAHTVLVTMRGTEAVGL
jgi:GAF domain-containing protein/PilZ domain-containing protein